MRRFALFFDDAPETPTHAEDVGRYAGSDTAALARAHADLVNRVDGWLRRRGLHGVSFMVPTAYAGTTCLPYHSELAGALRRGIGVGWTGAGVFAPQVTGAQARARRACLRHPVILWDNFPVNDGVLSNTLHLGPLTGRDAELPGALGGYLLNPMTQPRASLVGLGTAAAYLRAPARYDPEAAWRDALEHLDPSGGLAVLAEQTRSSALSDPDYADAVALAEALAQVEASYAHRGLDGGRHRARGRGAATGGGAGDDRGQHRGTRRSPTRFSPGSAELAAHAAAGLDAVRLLRAMKPGVSSLTTRVAGNVLTVSGRAHPPDAALADSLGAAFPPLAPPDSAGYLRCLGDLLGPNIRLCPEFGLNVHGKGLYVVPFDIRDIRIITGRNVHQHLIGFVGDTYRAWTARQAGSAVQLSLRLDGQPIELAADGSFSVVTQPSGGHTSRLVVETSAGDATAIPLP